MVVARHPLAATAGCGILEEGGNAVDACVAASFVNGVVQPVANTIGGGGHIVLVVDGTPAAIDYRYRAPLRARADMFDVGGPPPESGLFGWGGSRDRQNEIGHLSIATPGSVAGLSEALAWFGRLPLDRVLEPAIGLADGGFEMDWYGTLMQSIHLEDLTRFERTASTFLRDSRYPNRPKMIGPGDVHRQPELAGSLREIADAGPSAFYEGSIASSIERVVEQGGGILDREDLTQYRPRFAAPAELELGSYRVNGPLNMAIIVPLVRMLDLADLRHQAPDDPVRLHMIAEMLRVARREQLQAYGDEDEQPEVWARLSSVEHAEELLASINPERHRDFDEGPSSPSPLGGEGTVHISSIDADGNAVSLTETVLGNWGSAVTTDTGILLNNGMVGFNPSPGHPNSVGPGKRPVSFMSPLVALDRDGRAVLTLGASGGDRIAAAVLQVLSLALDLGMDLQEAIEAPRLDVDGELLLLDDRFTVSTERDLRALGHEVERRSEELSTFEFANPCGVRRTADGVLLGGVNQFQQTAAVGY